MCCMQKACAWKAGAAQSDGRNFVGDCVPIVVSAVHRHISSCQARLGVCVSICGCTNLRTYVLETCFEHSLIEAPFYHSCALTSGCGIPHDSRSKDCAIDDWL